MQIAGHELESPAVEMWRLFFFFFRELWIANLRIAGMGLPGRRTRGGTGNWLASAEVG